MNGYNDIISEPADDEEFAIACGYEIISADELYEVFTAAPGDPSAILSGPRKGNNKNRPKFRSNKGIGSRLSAISSGVSSRIMSKPMSSCSLSSQGTDSSDEDFSSDLSSGIPESIHPEEAADNHGDDHELSVENLWYIIQQKRHNHHYDHDMEEGMVHRHPHFLTLEHPSNSNKLTEWFHNLIHLPEKLRQISADKHRFNIKNVPEEIRDELKHIYVYWEQSHYGMQYISTSYIAFK